MPPTTLGRSVLWNHAGRIAEYGLTYLISVLVARQLGVEGNGTYAALVSIAQILLVLSSMGFEASLNKHIPQIDTNQNLESTRYLLRRVLLIRFYVVLLAATFFSALPHWLPDLLPQRISGYLLWVVLYAGSRSIWPLLSIVLVAQFNTPLVARIGVSARVLEFLGILLLSAAGAITVASVIAVLATVGVLQTFAYLVAARRNLLGPSRPMSLGPVVAFGSIFWLNSIVDYFLGRQGDILLLTALLRGTVQASLYDVAYSLTQVAFLAATVGFTGVSFAAFARLAVASRRDMAQFYGSLVRVVSLLSIPLYAFLLFNSPAVLALVYSEEFMAAAPLVSGIAAFRLVARLFAGGENAEFLLAGGQVLPVVGIGLVAASLNIGLDLALIPGYGALGCVVASGIAAVLVNGLGYVLVRRSGGPGLQLQSWFVLVLAASAVSLMVSLWFPGEASWTVAIAFLLHLGLTLLVLTRLRPLRSGDLEMFGLRGETGWLRRWIQPRSE